MQLWRTSYPKNVRYFILCRIYTISSLLSSLIIAYSSFFPLHPCKIKLQSFSQRSNDASRLSLHVVRIILRRERSVRKFAMLESRAKTSRRKSGSRSNIVAKLLRRNRERAIYVTVLFRHISRCTFPTFLTANFPFAPRVLHSDLGNTAKYTT